MMRKLRSKKMVLWVALCTILFVQAPHLALVFRNLSEFAYPYNLAHGILYGVVIELGVLFFAIRGRVWQTLLFAIVSSIITIEYYMPELKQRLVNDKFSAFIIILISITPSILVYLISDEIKNKK